MRRLLTSLASLGFAATLLGCHHTCGICDCDRPGDPCNYYAPSDHAAMPEAISAKPLPAATGQSNPGMQKVLEK
jgi:hypothetical protein